VSNINFNFHWGKSKHASGIPKTPPSRKCHFGGFDAGDKSAHHTHRVGSGLPAILCIYSLGHFLTTKGALIDGVAVSPKTPKNDPKNH